MAATRFDRNELAAAVYDAAVQRALSLVPRHSWEAEEVAVNAATDAILWCLDHADDAGDWPALVRSQVATFVRRRMSNWRKRQRPRAALWAAVPLPTGDEEPLPRETQDPSGCGRLTFEVVDCLTSPANWIRYDHDEKLEDRIDENYWEAFPPFDRSRLAWEQREAVATLHYLEGKSVAEAAGIMNIPERAVRLRLAEFNILDPAEIDIEEDSHADDATAAAQSAARRLDEKRVRREAWHHARAWQRVEAVRLYYTEECSTREGADRLGVSEGTFRTLLNEAGEILAGPRIAPPHRSQAKRLTNS